MLPHASSPTASRISYACYDHRSRTGEQFVPYHVFSYQLAGQSTVSDGERTQLFEAGSFRLIRRNHLFKFTKLPPAGGGEFRTVAVCLGQPLLRTLSQEYGYPAGHSQQAPAILPLAPHALFQSYFESLRPYEQLAQPAQTPLQTLKVREAALVLLHVRPDLQGLLFDFSEPGKIDLAAFMETNFRFNVPLSRFAYLTGRSLATFKRDFGRLFRQPPSRWLVQRRLREAHFLLTAHGLAPSEVYLEVGFEDLSHFSFAFKKTYGWAPSRLADLKSR
jgi:AraC-like DNA-binding protein